MATRIERYSLFKGVQALLLVGLLAPAGVSGQEPIVPFQLSLSDPGARSMGFGGAFVALADDATAAFSNPAGLVQLLEPEVSIEARQWSYSNPYTVGGRLEGLPSGYGIDTTAGLRMANSEDKVTGLSFLSLAYPQGDWTFALFRHQLAELEFFSETQGLFSGGTDCCQIREYDQRSSSDMKFLSYGLSAAYRISEKFDIGFGVVHHDTSLTSEVTVYGPDDDTVDSILGLNSYLPENSVISQKMVSDETDWSLTGGLLWRLSDNWSIGGVYRQGADIEIGGEVTAGQAVDLGVPPGGVLVQVEGQKLELPDMYGIGFAYRAPDGRLTVSFQWDQVEYSSVPRSLDSGGQTIDDANELHVGAEYVFIQATPIFAVRLGAWFEPDHQMRATTDNVIVRALVPPGDDEMHYALGLGVATQRFQIDFGVDFADRVDTVVSLSAIYNFQAKDR